MIVITPRKSDRWYQLTNFGRGTFYDEYKRKWLTSEHYFQASKFFESEPEYAEKIRLAPSPWQAKQLGKDPRHVLPQDWEERKYDCMLEANRKRFQNVAMRELLLSTGDKYLQFNSECYWGGEINAFGMILMKIQSKL